MILTFCIALASFEAWVEDRPCHVTATVSPCRTEDGANCYWDAQAAGNGTGRSFIDVDGFLYTWVKS